MTVIEWKPRQQPEGNPTTTSERDLQVVFHHLTSYSRKFYNEEL